MKNNTFFPIENIEDDWDFKNRIYQEYQVTRIKGLKNVRKP